MKHISFLGLLFAAAMLWGGGQGLLTALANREPSPVTCEELARARPKGSWLRLVDCEIDLEHGGYEGLTEPRELYLPLRAPGAPESEPAHVVLQSTDPSILSMVRILAKVDTDDPAALADFLRVHASQISGKNTYEGLIQFGIELKDSKRDEVRAVTGNVVDDFVILKHGEAPRPLFSGGMFAGGLLVLGFLVRRALRSQAAEATA